MTRSVLYSTCILLFTAFVSTPSHAQPEPAGAQPPAPGDRLDATASPETYRIPSANLMEDFEILKRSLLTLHPALDRYHEPSYFESNLKKLEQALHDDLTYKEAYRVFSQFVATVQCGHTHVNPWNQSDLIQEMILNGTNKLPFTFDLIEKRMIVTRSVAGDDRIRAGTEITAINGAPVPAILDSLTTIVAADGSNDAMRLYELQVSGTERYELFDIYFPLFFPWTGETLTVEARTPENASEFSAEVSPISRQERVRRLAERYGPQPESYDDLWQFEILDDDVAYLQLGTFVTYKMDLDWKKFLDDAFATMDEQKIPNLIVDIRGNGGGMDEVYRVLLQHLSRKTVTLPSVETRIQYQAVPEDIRPYVGSWNDAIFDLSLSVEDTGKGYYAPRNESGQPPIYPPSPDAYQGDVYLLVDAANSSATFTLAKVVQDNGIGTLVGQPTGGNLRGTNGGQMFFLNLPHSKVEVDLPVYGYYPREAQPDRGVIPDVTVDHNIEDVARGRDAVLEAALDRIQRSP